VAQENLFARVPAAPELASDAANLLIDEVGIFDLIRAFQNILTRRTAQQEDLREIFEENFTVGDKIDHVLRLIGSGVALKFEEMFPERATRTEIVVTFLAMLELIRMKQLRVRQDQDFGEIWIERAMDVTPLFTSAATTES
jgi:segregation and condensation protein A